MENRKDNNSFSRLPHREGTGNILRPALALWPMGGKPADDIVVLFGSKGLSFSNARKKTTVCRTVPPNSRLTQLSGFREAVAKYQEVACKFGFHTSPIVGCFQLCNGKVPIRQVRGKFPILEA